MAQAKEPPVQKSRNVTENQFKSVGEADENSKLAYDAVSNTRTTAKKQINISQASQDASLKYLHEKYKKGSPRVIQEPPPPPSQTFGV